MNRVLLFTWMSVLMLACTAEVRAAVPTRTEIKRMIIEEASATAVPVELALAVAKVESDFNARARSSAGARGVMQIMPETARSEYGLPADSLWDPRTNIRTGVDFLARLYESYGRDWERALSHYNGGSLKNGRPHGYTREYVSTVFKWRGIYAEQAAIWRALGQMAAARREFEETREPLDDGFDPFADEAALEERPPRAEGPIEYPAPLDIEPWEPWEAEKEAVPDRIVIVEPSYDPSYDDGWEAPPPRFRRPPPRHRSHRLRPRRHGR